MHFLFLFLTAAVQGVLGEVEEVTAKPGDDILLSCPVNTEVCGDFHSLKWYREDSRVYVYSPLAQFSNGEGALGERGTLIVTNTSADLKIFPVELRDEGEYRCEITYLDISNNCPVVHFTDVRTVAAPESLTIVDSNDEDITGQVVGPYAEGSEVAFSCQSGGGKPEPAMSWMFGQEIVEGETTVSEDTETGSVTVTSLLVVRLDREHSGAALTCRVEHEILDEPLNAQIQVDVNVPVSSVSIAAEVSGQAGVDMRITCTTIGGRPAPTVFWIMPDTVQFQLEESSSLLDDETFESISKMMFTPSSEENTKEVSCQAINDIMDEALEDRAELIIEYAPQVNVEEGNTTVTAGDEVTIECEVDANPAELSDVQWFHNDIALDVNEDRFEWENTATPSLSISPAQPGDAGEYSCSAGNKVGQARSPLTFRLLVTAAVNSVTIQDGLTGNEDEEMTIVCTAEGASPAASIDWIVTEELIFEVEEEIQLMADGTFETTSRLKFTPSKELNELEVTCQALNDVMAEALEDKAELNIIYPPIVTMEEGNKTVDTGEELIIECIIDANPRNLTLVQWYHNGNAVDTNDDRYQWDTNELASLSINHAEAADSGEYYCLAENAVGQGRSEDILNIDIIAVVESVMIEHEAGTAGEEMVITCVATGGHPAAAITWTVPEMVIYSAEEEVQILEDESFVTISKLTVTPSAEENEKKVSCQAINDVMNEPVEYETELDILYKPIVSIEEENKTVTAGDQVTLVCLVDANPMNLSLVEWYHNEDLIDDNEERYEDGNPEAPSLTIKAILPEDAGDYYCLAHNHVGQSRSNMSVSLQVIYPPEVEIRKDPTAPVSEEDDMNVTLHCDLIGGNPLELVRVSWFMNGELIRQLPDPHCDQLQQLESEEIFDEEFISEAGDYEVGSGVDDSGIIDIGSGMEMGSAVNPDGGVNVNYLCDVDPTELFLQHVTRAFSGHFSCSGSNMAGEGPVSESVDLDVLYLPGQAVISQEEEEAQKGGSVTLQCQLEDQGNPVAKEYIWTKGEDILAETSANLTLHNIAVDSQGNFSCAGVNDLGQGEGGSLQLIVFAPQTFVQSLPETSTFVSHDTDFNLQCEVECFPLCSIQWMKDDEVITLDDDRYFIEEEITPEDVEANQFQSVSSKLSWNLENLPDNKLDHDDLNFTVSCFVEETEIGAGISSSTEIEIEYGPENLDISTTFVSIEENERIQPIFCSGEGVPEPSVVWKFNDQEVTAENTLDFSEPIKRKQGGDYSCHVSNEHGEEVVNVTIDVLYKPECTIDYTLEEEEVVLVCTAEANPQDVQFWWEKDNITFDGQNSEDTLESLVRLKIMNESIGTYYCHVSNSVGKGEPCMIELTEWMMTKGLSEEVIVILIAVAGSVIVLLIIIVITACLYCGERKEKGGKANMKKNKSKSPLLKDDQLHADSSFYENLPFKGLKSPPKQVLDDPKSDMMDYADADYLDIYANGPLKYREASEKNATLRRKKLEERKAVKSELL
eukprot:GFUD01009889.1.p1 GENE.GFUD01009889.1~~GFUD01009889.1.p1  ORF type:complete len:1498 (+),score=504.87 GFUD01009889.1:68-4561(+)